MAGWFFLVISFLIVAVWIFLLKKLDPDVFAASTYWVGALEKEGIWNLEDSFLLRKGLVLEFLSKKGFYFWVIKAGFVKVYSLFKDTDLFSPIPILEPAFIKLY